MMVSDQAMTKRRSESQTEDTKNYYKELNKNCLFGSQVHRSY